MGVTEVLSKIIGEAKYIRFEASESERSEWHLGAKDIRRKLDVKVVAQIQDLAHSLMDVAIIREAWSGEDIVAWLGGVEKALLDVVTYMVVDFNDCSIMDKEFDEVEVLANNSVKGE